MAFTACSAVIQLNEGEEIRALELHEEISVSRC